MIWVVSEDEPILYNEMFKNLYNFWIFLKLVNVHNYAFLFNFVMKNCDHVSVNIITCSIWSQLMMM